MKPTWTQDHIDAEVATYGDDWEYRPMQIEELLRDMIDRPGNASWVGMKLMDEYCGKPTNYAATTIFRAMVEAYAAERGIELHGKSGLDEKQKP